MTRQKGFKPPIFCFVDITFKLVAIHSMRGAIFENLVIGELLKHQYALGEPANLYGWRDNNGLEIDVIIDQGETLIPIEIKSGQTINKDFFKNLKKWKSLAGDQAERAYLIYGGDEDQDRSDAQVLSWRNLDKLFAHWQRGSHC